ncbi:terpenoid synthase [Exidia glandulosa HHB12029]|uniref:Terpene synthase n=1 Tax=Exidia glandulosa HHB12029 TaxID=1314781 RepID=A0A166NE86_EXIGL|nr:terpenoid synthase [Exidia glandulosa HHB12029]
MATPVSDSSDVEQPVYCLPDNLRNWPWLRCINPFYEEAKKASTAWIRGFRAFSPKAQKAFERCDFDVLRVTCDLMQLVFVFDDYTDRGCADEVRVMADAMMDGLRQPDGPKPHMLGTMMKQFWQRVMPLASPGVQSRFIAHFQDWVDSVVEQALDRDSARSRNVEEYMAVRRLTIGAYFAFVLHQLGQQVPDESAFDRPVIQRLETLAAEMIILANDAYSYNVEQARGDTHNILAVVRDQYNWPLDRALQWIAEQHDELVAEFLETKDSVPPELAKYVDGLGNWVRANDAWSFESQRYFGKGGLDVMSKREVILLPKQVTPQ